ncbi:MAG: DUF4302 domain-containing protein [Rhizobacter sp.]|nr:DUF4302 domain-containing protein [Ferruginibacter sp.]
MKKVLIFIFIVAVGISSCKKEDKAVFEKSADERLNEKLAAYQSQLSGALNGWKGLLTTDSGKGGVFSFYFKFNAVNRVMMLSDFDTTSAVTLKESSYRLKALQQPSLIFDTYSYLHVLSDPDASLNGGGYGAGLSSDFEFYFDSGSTDTIKLVGRFNASKLVLVRASKPEEDAYNAGALGIGLSINKILTYFKRLTIGTQLYDVKIDPLTRKFTFSWLDASGNLVTFTTGYYFTPGGIVFTTPLVNGSQTIPGFTNITWTAATETINLTVNATAATITGIVIPLKVDIAAPKRWWDYAANLSDYWISRKGFHVNGVDDAYGIQTLTSGTPPNTYYYLIYWPKYAPANDFFGPVFLNPAQTGLTLIYGTAPRVPTFTADGRAVFLQLGNYGTHPTTGPAGLTRTLLYNTSGYYFVQTGATTYDMVSAFNGKSWINWVF